MSASALCAKLALLRTGAYTAVGLPREQRGHDVFLCNKPALAQAAEEMKRSGMASFMGSGVHVLCVDVLFCVAATFQHFSQGLLAAIIVQPVLSIVARMLRRPNTALPSKGLRMRLALVATIPLSLHMVLLDAGPEFLYLDALTCLFLCVPRVSRGASVADSPERLPPPPSLAHSLTSTVTCVHFRSGTWSGRAWPFVPT